MNSFFAAIFSDRNSADEAHRQLQQFRDDNLFNVVASVVIAKNDDAVISKHDGKSPGALGAGLGGIVGGILGLLAGPAGLVAGAAAGAVSGGWFDLLRAEEREIFSREVATKIGVGSFALLVEVIDPSEEAKALFETRVHELGGSIVLKDC